METLSVCFCLLSFLMTYRLSVKMLNSVTFCEEGEGEAQDRRFYITKFSDILQKRRGRGTRQDFLYVLYFTKSIAISCHVMSQKMSLRNMIIVFLLQNIPCYPQFNACEIQPQRSFCQIPTEDTVSIKISYDNIKHFNNQCGKIQVYLILKYLFNF